MARALFALCVFCTADAGLLGAISSLSGHATQRFGEADPGPQVVFYPTAVARTTEERLRNENARLRARLSLAEQRFSGGSAVVATASPIAAYSKVNVGQLVAGRGGWLSLFLLSLSLTSVVMSGFEHTLAKQIELAYFVPLLIGHGGNAGGQTVGTVLGGLSSGDLKLSDWSWVVPKEMLAGVGSGAVTCLAILPLLAAMQISPHVTAAVVITLPVLTVRKDGGGGSSNPLHTYFIYSVFTSHLSQVLAAGLAAGLPFFVAACGLDPTAVAAPAMTTLVDVCGLLAYFSIARLVFAFCGLDM
jgi:Mg/Co/Ni transporter MgtE